MAKRADPLSTYRAKRDFAVTREPAPKRPSKAKKSKDAGAQAPTFMVHKHDAARLHYDLRLEMDGVLASWAIPKGPSYDPGLKRLAVQTEDHPLEYGSFEGRIPDGEYGGGDSMIWDRGTYDTVPPGQASAQRKKGHLVVELKGEKLQGTWHLVRTRPLGTKAQWLCFKAKDGTERTGFDVVAERPESVVSGRRITRGPERKKTLAALHPRADALLKKVWPPMKAVLSKPEEATAATHLFEVKYDGYRALAARSGTTFALRSRNGLDFAERYPEVAQALQRIHVAEMVLDGEIIATDKEGVSRFQELQGAAPTRYAAFDLLWLDGEDLRARPLEERRELLESVLANVKGPVELAERVEGSTAEALQVARDRKLEGVMAKRRGSSYVNARSSAWLKLKVMASQEVAIVGFTPISNGAPEVGALLLAVKNGDDFQYAGKVGTGFDQKTRRKLKQLLTQDASAKPTAVGAPRMKAAIWAKPRLVAQVTFSEWTRDGKLRHPSFQGLREDKKPEDCTRETVAAPTAKGAGTSRKKPVAPSSGERRAASSHAGRTQKAASAPSAPVEVPLTHPERVVFPKSKLTKLDVVGYYEAVAPHLLKALEDRPLSMQQWPRGISAPSFFRQGSAHVPPFIRTATVPHETHPVEHILVDRPETLRWLANQSALTLHMMSSRLGSLDEPDWVGFDLDPAETGWEALVPLAQALRGLLEELKLKSLPKTSGKRGLHVLVPVAAGYSHTDALNFAVAITEVLGKKFPKLGTTERALTARKGRLYLDAFQNGRLKTLVAPYSLRALEGAPASTPLEWDEVALSLDPLELNLRTLPKRLERVGDLFARALTRDQRLPNLD